jgi:hypothetical protein
LAGYDRKIYLRVATDEGHNKATEAFSNGINCVANSKIVTMMLLVLLVVVVVVGRYCSNPNEKCFLKSKME